MYNPKKRRGQFVKWQSCWTGPYVVENKLNQMNYVVKRGRGKAAVIHIDRMRKLPNELGLENSDSPEDDMCSTSQPKLQRRGSNAAMETNTHCMNTASCTDSDSNMPLFQFTGGLGAESVNVCTSDDLDAAELPGTGYQSSTCVAAAVGLLDSAARLFPRSTRRRQCPIRHLGDVFAGASLIGRYASRVVGCLADSRISKSHLPTASVIRRIVAVKRSVVSVDSSVVDLCKVDKMPNKRRGQLNVEPSDSESSGSDWDNNVLPDVICKPCVPIMKLLTS